MQWRHWISWIKDKIQKKRKLIVIGSLCFAFLSLSVIVLAQNSHRKQIEDAKLLTASLPTPTSLPSPTPTATPSATPIPTKAVVIPQSSNKILFGIGSQAGPAMDFRIVKEAPVHMLTSWYNGTKDLEWMQVQKNDLIPRLYANHYIVHLITWTDLPEEEIQTPHGPACGRAYPVSTQVIEDMKQLAQIYAGNGPMYVSLFTEFPSYTCTDNNWIGNENYYETLKDNYRLIKNIFHQYAPQSKVSLSWGGWVGLYDNQESQGGQSLISHFADVIRESDFASFQAMESDTNVQEILNMTRILGSYGKPVMLAHYKPSNGSEEVFNNDMRTLFTDTTIKQLTSYGLFAMSFMDEEMLNQSDTSYNIVATGIQKYGK